MITGASLILDMLASLLSRLGVFGSSGRISRPTGKLKNSPKREMELPKKPAPPKTAAVPPFIGQNQQKPVASPATEPEKSRVEILRERIHGKVNSPDDDFITALDRGTLSDPRKIRAKKIILQNNAKILQRHLQRMKDEGEIIKLPNGQWQKTEKFKPGPSYANARTLR